MSGLGDRFQSKSIEISVLSGSQCVEFSSGFRIPLTDIKGSYITTDGEVPIEDINNKFTFYIHIKYQKNGENSELVFSNHQKQYPMLDDHIAELNYIMNNINRKINNFSSPQSQQYLDKQSVSQQDFTVILRNLKSLLDDGIITQEEFEAKKKDILGL